MIPIENSPVLHTDTSHDDQLADNIQTFIQIGQLQVQAELKQQPAAIVDLRNLSHGKKLLLLDMDETLLHAATL